MQHKTREYYQDGGGEPRKEGNERLARSLEALHAAQQGGIVRSADLGRTDRERVLKAGFAHEIVRGWLVVTNPAVLDGASTAWYASFWAFLARYLAERFGDDYCLSAEASIKHHAASTMVPSQVVAMTRDGANHLQPLCFGTSLLTYRERANFPENRVARDGLWMMDLPSALARVPASFFRGNPEDAEIALRTLRDPSQLIRLLLEEGSSAAAGRLAGAYAFLGEHDTAADIVGAMGAASFAVRQSNPFERPEPLLEQGSRILSPHAARVQTLWAAMRPAILAGFPLAPGAPADPSAYLAAVDEQYAADAYNSLSIEGYQVSPALIERVRSGDWNPSGSEDDGRQASALAARGYFLAFQAVKGSLGKILSGEPAGGLVLRDHQAWYREMFSPAVDAGILGRASLAGYRNNRVYLRGSRHVPPAPEAVMDCMEALFDLLRGEPEPGVRAVLGHFLFGYIHPYPDGNGRISRFLMNAMLASGGYPWTVIRQTRRGEYLAALEAASTDQDIAPFVRFVREEMEAPRA